MPVTMNFLKQKIVVLAFTDENDLRYTIHRLVELDRTGSNWPKYYLIDDPDTSEQDIHDVTHFLEEMQKLTDDARMVKENLRKDRFKELL
ncbi:MAG: hypothetical protein EHM49_01780 [Deltaproteobacteria bacterium]|nr:MAG: hypothetical protein EHM49_01780 [Deltaproteobacteria bacterium]